MRETDHIDLSTIAWSRLTLEERLQLRRRIVEQAHVARARALLDLLRRPLSLALRAGTAVAAWMERRRAIRELRALDDRSLRDIGLGRSEIEAAVRAEPFLPTLRHRASQRGRNPMTPDQKRLIKETWNMVVPIADTAAELFYNRLFEIDPTTRALFRTTNMAEQRKKLMQLLGAALKGLDDLDALLPVVENLGRRHQTYGVADAHYESVGAALLWTLEKGLGNAWTPAAAEAWTTLYIMISGIMRRAAAEASMQTAAAKAA